MLKLILMGFLLFVVVVLFGVYYYWQMEIKETAPPLPENPLFKDASIPTEQRIADLLSYMTLSEKIGQMALVEKNSIHSTADVSKYGLGAVLSGFGGSPENNTPAGWREMVQVLQNQASHSRLGIPLLYGVDAIHGHSNVPGFTVFPHAIGLGASGDAKLVRAVAQATRKQVEQTAINWSYSPTYDLPQDIRWGRVYEAFSDDPDMAGRLGSAYIKGLQGESSVARKDIAVLATPKHFIGAGSMVWNSSSNQDFSIDQGMTPVDQRRLKEVYLPPYEEAIAAGAMSIMAGLNSWGETKLAAERYLLTTVLKEELNFTGFVVSDWYGVYEISTDDYQSASTAINAGVDMVMLPYDYKKFVRNVRRAVQVGDISEQRIDDAVTRILRAKFAAGLFATSTAAVAPVDTAADKELARQAVAQSAVLLKNNAVLPIAASAQSILVSGSAADNSGLQAGAWTVEWQGVDGNWLPGSTSIWAGIKAAAHPAADIQYNASAQFAREDKKADIAIAVVGESPYAEGWGDQANPTLSTADLAIIDKLKAQSKKLIVVLVTGRPLIITEQLQQWDGLVVVWLPGSEGAGVSDVLFGTEKFTGRLPLPWPASTEQLPIGTTGETQDGSPLLFERYFGLQN